MAKIDPEKWQLSADGQFYEMKPEVAKRYRETVQEQLDYWVAGTPKHNNEFDECCPDFSCCGSPMWSDGMRNAFKNASDEARLHMLMTGLVAIAPKDTYVAGQPQNHNPIH